MAEQNTARVMKVILINYNEFIKELNNLFGSEIKDEKFEL